MLFPTEEEIMGQPIGQESRHQPAVVWDGSLMHMVFSSNGDDNRILYATSPNGFDWTLGADTGQTSGAAPALTLSVRDEIGLKWKLLVLVFVANDPSHRILCSILDLNDDPNTRGWKYIGQVGEESAQAVFALSGLLPGVVAVYFTANDPTNRLLVQAFNPYP
jgi:hypothetical protein